MPQLRHVCIGVGDGGCLAVIQDAKALLEEIKHASDGGMPEHATHLLESVGISLINTNEFSLQRAARAIQNANPKLKVETLLIGQDRFEGQGAGQDVDAARRAMEDVIENGDVEAFLTKNGTPESAKLNMSWGDGATGLGGGPELIRFCREKMHLLTLPVITTASVEFGEVSASQARIIEETIDGLGRDEIGFVRVPTTHIAKLYPSLPKQRLFEMADRHQALAMGGIIRILTLPVRVDRSDISRLYASDRWTMRGQRISLSKASAEGYAEIKALASQLLEGWCDFEFGKTGRVLLWLQHEGLSNAAERALRQELLAQLNKHHAMGEKKFGNPNLKVKSATFTGPRRWVSCGIWAAHHAPDYTCPEIAWLPPKEDSYVIVLSSEESETDPEPLALEASAPATAAPALVPALAASQEPEFRYSWASFEELLLALKERGWRRQEALAVFARSGEWFKLREQEVTYSYTEGGARITKTAPVVNFAFHGAEFGRQVLELAPLLDEVQSRLPDDHFPETLIGMFAGAIDSCLNSAAARLPRYLPGDFPKPPVDLLTVGDIEDIFRSNAYKRLKEEERERIAVTVILLRVLGRENMESLVEPEDKRTMFQRVRQAPGQWFRRQLRGVKIPLRTRAASASGD